MDAATLRLILIVVGAALLVALYLWERRRAEANAGLRRRAAPRRRAPAAASKREPNLGRFDGEDESAGAAAEAGAASTPATAFRTAFEQDRQSERTPESDWETDWETDWEPERDSEQPEWESRQSEPSATAPDAYRPAAESPAPESEAPMPGAPEPQTHAERPETTEEPRAQAPEPEGIVVQLYVVSAGEPFAGHRILSIAEDHKLMPGEMDIFHRHANEDAAQPPLFSMATMHKPGTFPFDDLGDFTTKGLALFAQLHGDSSDLMVFDEMLAAARALAGALKGEVQERGGTPLTDERAEALRAEVLAMLQQEWDATEHR